MHRNQSKFFRYDCVHLSQIGLKEGSFVFLSRAKFPNQLNLELDVHGKTQGLSGFISIIGVENPTRAVMKLLIPDGDSGRIVQHRFFLDGFLDDLCQSSLRHFSQRRLRNQDHYRYRHSQGNYQVANARAAKVR
jgi:hypothetical protein